jgi:uncharacterized membrane protein
MENIFSLYHDIVVFVHVVSAVVWVGGMVAIRFVVHYATANIPDTHTKLETNLIILKRFFNLVIVFVIGLLGSAVVMSFSLQDTKLYQTVIHKEIVWVMMTVVFVYIYMLRHKAQKLFDNKEYTQTKTKLSIIPQLFIPINIALGLFAIYLGVGLS